MMEKTKKLVIVGAGEFAEIAYEYFTYDSCYDVVAFAVEHDYRKADTLFELPVIDFEKMNDVYSEKEYEIFVAITYTQLNRARRRLVLECKKMGYRCASYISSKAFVWHNVEIGENTFIFEHSILQHHAKIGNSVIIWAGSHIGHRTVIEDDCWLAPCNAISGFCHVGSGCFLGANATLGDNVTLAKDIVLGAGALAVKDLPKAGQVYIGSPAKLLGRTSYKQFDIEED